MIGELSLPDLTDAVFVGRALEIRLAQTANWLVGTVGGAGLRIREFTNGEHGQHDCNRFDLIVGGDVEVGWGEEDRGGGFLLCGEGVMDWRGDVNIAALNNAGADNQNKIETESAHILLGGTLDATGILMTGTGAAHIQGGTVQNTADKGVTGTVYALLSRDGGNNDPNVIFGLGGNLTGTGTRTTRLFGPIL